MLMFSCDMSVIHLFSRSVGRSVARSFAFIHSFVRSFMSLVHSVVPMAAASNMTCPFIPRLLFHLSVSFFFGRGRCTFFRGCVVVCMCWQPVIVSALCSCILSFIRPTSQPVNQRASNVISFVRGSCFLSVVCRSTCLLSFLKKNILFSFNVLKRVFSGVFFISFCFLICYPLVLNENLVPFVA